MFPLTLSIMSTSPLEGHGSGPFIQNAGHVAHPVGTCETSRMNSPESYCLYEWMRTDERGTYSGSSASCGEGRAGERVAGHTTSQRYVRRPL